MNMDKKPIFDAIRAQNPDVWNKAGNITIMDRALDSLDLEQWPAASQMAWGAKVSPAFRERVRAMAKHLGGAATPSDYMACMAWESGRSFAPNKRNMAGSGATGLIQFMPSTARALGTTTDALAAMSAVEQLEWVERYFEPYRGRLNNLADLYMAILWPVAVGKPLEYALWDNRSRPTTYRQNSGLDANRDGVITKAEAAGKVYGMLAEGNLPQNKG